MSGHRVHACLAVAVVWMAYGCSRHSRDQPAEVTPVQVLGASDASVARVIDARPHGALPGMVEVPAGPGLNCFGREGKCLVLPPPNVQVPAFEIDKTEVTVAAYAECVSAGACTPPRADDRHVRLPDDQGCADPSLANWGHVDRRDHPINCVTPRQAATYCAYRGERLPTRDEWDRAAVGDDGRAYPWGDHLPTCRLAIIAARVHGKNGCGAGHSWPVGSRPRGASPYGAEDMIGNVAEFYVYLDNWRAPEPLIRVAGAGFDYPPPDLFNGNLERADGYSDFGGPGIGFRCLYPVAQLDTTGAEP
jgi:formylglycine-generating enzyme required for sulfatase activity